MDTTWVFDKGVRKTLGERSLPDWKKWLKDNDVSLKPFIAKYYDGDLEEDLRMLRMRKVDEWLFDFVQSPQGLQAARMLTPDHPALEPSSAYDPTEAMLKAGPVAFGNQVLVATEKEVLVGVKKVPPPRDLYQRGYKKEAEFDGVKMTVLGSALEFEVNKREQLFQYMKERKSVDLDALPERVFPESSTIVICDSEGLRPELLVEGAFRILEEKEACVIDWRGSIAIRTLCRLKDVTGQTMDYGQAEVTRNTHEADAVFIVEDPA